MSGLDDFECLSEPTTDLARIARSRRNDLTDYGHLLSLQDAEIAAGITELPVDILALAESVVPKYSLDSIK